MPSPLPAIREKGGWAKTQKECDIVCNDGKLIKRMMDW